MLGFVLAVVAFAKTGKNIFEQIQSWPQPVFAVFALIAVGTLVPILRSALSTCIFLNYAKASTMLQAMFLDAVNLLMCV